MKTENTTPKAANFIDLRKKPMSIFDQLYSKSNHHVKSYKTDFEHDRRLIEEYNGDPFIHIAREGGTEIGIFVTDLSIFPKKGETAKYLFGYSTREHIIKNNFSSIEYYAKCCRDEKKYLIHYFDGKKLSKITFETAIKLKDQYIENVLQQWENEEKIN